jgi:hypothetical protein
LFSALVRCEKVGRVIVGKDADSIEDIFVGLEKIGERVDDFFVVFLGRVLLF